MSYAIHQILIVVIAQEYDLAASDFIIFKFCRSECRNPESLDFSLHYLSSRPSIAVVIQF